MPEATKNDPPPPQPPPQKPKQEWTPNPQVPGANILVNRPAEAPKATHKDGKLTAYGIRKVVEGGGSVSVRGTMITHVDAIPTDDQLDKFHAEQDAILHGWDQANRSQANRGIPQPAPDKLAQPAFNPPQQQPAAQPQHESIGVQPQTQPPR